MLSGIEAWGREGGEGVCGSLLVMGWTNEWNGGGYYIGFGSPEMFIRSHAMITFAFNAANGVKSMIVRWRECEGEPRLGVKVIRYHSDICSELFGFNRVTILYPSCSEGYVTNL